VVFGFLMLPKALIIGNNEYINFLYPVFPWLGVMLLGFYFGKLYKNDFNVKIRRKSLFTIGIVSLTLFLILRFVNVFGDLKPWSIQKK
jgi:uncharacterized membrane protein